MNVPRCVFAFAWQTLRQQSAFDDVQLLILPRFDVRLQVRLCQPVIEESFVLLVSQVVLNDRLEERRVFLQ